ncbi:hypothetical protein BDQ17DRAFT_1357102 [Cyathus striatus]|nr:hypothetical protein BDQ17DRAFT_1357102 [Cyathus striatus]
MPAISSAQPQVVLGYSNELSSSSRPLDPLVDGDPYSLMSAYALEIPCAVGLTTPQPNPLTPPLTAQASQSDTIISSPNGYANHAVVQNGHSLLNTLPFQFPLTRDTGASDSLYNLQQPSPASSAGSSHRSNISGLTTNSSSIYSSQPPSSSNRRNRTERSNGRTTAPIPTAVAAPTPTRPAYVHAATTPAPVPRTSRPQTSAENRRDSTLSWGTIDAAQSNQAAISYSYHEPADTHTPRNSDLASSSSITASITSSVSSRRGQYPPTPSMQILAGSHGTQNTQVITEPEPQTQTQTRSQESRERREWNMIPSCNCTGCFYLWVELYLRPPMSAGNALGLDLNAGTPRMSEIVAPTPRFSAQPLLRSFSTSDRS